jgi:hypothetical protein
MINIFVIRDTILFTAGICCCCRVVSSSSSKNQCTFVLDSKKYASPVCAWSSVLNRVHVALLTSRSFWDSVFWCSRIDWMACCRNSSAFAWSWRAVCFVKKSRKTKTPSRENLLFSWGYFYIWDLHNIIMFSSWRCTSCNCWRVRSWAMDILTFWWLM